MQVVHLFSLSLKSVPHLKPHWGSTTSSDMASDHEGFENTLAKFTKPRYIIMLLQTCMNVTTMLLWILVQVFRADADTAREMEEKMEGIPARVDIT